MLPCWFLTVVLMICKRMKKYYLVTFFSIYFDSVSNKQLLEMHVLEPTDVHIKLFMRYDLQHGYEYLYVAKRVLQ